MVCEGRNYLIRGTELSFKPHPPAPLSFTPVWRMQEKKLYKFEMLAPFFV